MSIHTFITRLSAVAVLAVLFIKLKARLELSRAKHRSLAGHARMARRVASSDPVL